jgi:hypothetical protein
VPVRLALTFKDAGRQAGPALAAEASDLAGVVAVLLVDEPQPASESPAVAISTATAEVARLTRVVIRLLRLACSGVRPSLVFRVCSCDGPANFAVPVSSVRGRASWLRDRSVRGTRSGNRQDRRLLRLC